MKFKSIALAAAVSFVMIGQTGTAYAACGYWAFGGAFQSFAAANRQARQARNNAGVFDLDDSNSPNAGKGFYVVAVGVGSKSDANVWKREFERRGITSYVAKRCLYGDALN
jgi:hypothetical protein